MDELKRVEKELKKCVKCGACRAHCPAFAEFRREPAVARGKVALAQHIIKGDMELDDGTYVAMSKCLLCGSCVDKCPNDVPTDEIVVAAREALAAKRGLTTFHTAVGKVIRSRSLMNFGALAGYILGPLFFRKVPENSGLRLRFPLPFIGGRRHIPELAKKPFLKRTVEVIKGEPDKPKVVFFVGCMSNFVYTGIAESTVALLRHMGCTVIIPKEQQCCGLPAMSGGDAATVRGLAEKNLAELERYEADYVVTSCATCGGALNRFYPLVVGKKNPELRERLDRLAKKQIDISVLLQKLGFDPAALAPAGFSDGPSTSAESRVPSPGLTVTWHDPCHLRTHGIAKQPRDLLKRAPGVSLREMEGADRCCGLGGTFNVYHYDASMGINAGKTAAILKTGAEAAVTGCPGCIMQLSDGLKQQGSELPVVHLVEILARGLQQSR